MSIQQGIAAPSGVPVIANRYELLERLGGGGMGVVYRAYDRLTRQQVALKQVHAPVFNLSYSRHNDSSPALALAREFRILAALRHPNIINVLDYGFDHALTPYYVMTLLEGARPLDEAAEALPFAEKIGLLTAVLQALVYLHRHRVLHLDLKPGNILVTPQGEVKLLDFGLAVEIGQARGLAGTLAYLAPEILFGGATTVASDLYSFGVVAYEVLARQRPAQGKTVADLLDQVRYHRPDTAALQTPEAVRLVIARLLLKDPASRYASAGETLHALCTAAGLPLPPESRAVRESFLQAARFVGRQTELAQLTGALLRVKQGHGSAWLVAGESGVGKSRLVEEVRTRALVEGVCVLHGQVEYAGTPFDAWHSPVYRLALSAALSDAEASLLQWITPDLADLLGRPLPPAPELHPETLLVALAEVIVKALGQCQQALLLIVEDLQWMVESLTLLRLVIERMGKLRLMILGTYRSDEAPYLYGKLPLSVRLLELPRLSSAELGELSEAMLGAAGRQPAVQAMLVRQSEGNAFFAVEILRALAEETGGLDAIDHATLAPYIFTRGMDDFVQRRVARLPQQYHPLLQVAALLGRSIDDLTLRHVAARLGLDPDQWYLSCSEHSLIRSGEEGWRFSHDKLREGILRQIPQADHARLARLAAESIETCYARHSDHAERLMVLWQQAGDLFRAAAYGVMAAERNYALGNLALVVQQGQSILEALAQQRGGFQHERMQLAYWVASALDRIGQPRESQGHVFTGLELARTLGDRRFEARFLEILAPTSAYLGDIARAYALGQEALGGYETLQDYAGQANLLGGFLARMEEQQGNIRQAAESIERALLCLNYIDNPVIRGRVLMALAHIRLKQGQLGEALDAACEGEGIVREYHDLYMLCHTLEAKGHILLARGDVAAARAALDEMMALAEKIHESYMLIWGFSTWARTYFVENRPLVNKEQAVIRARLLNAFQLARQFERINALLPPLNIWIRLQLAQAYPDNEALAELLGLFEAQMGHVTLAGLAESYRAEARQIRQTLGQRLKPAVLQAAIERGRVLDLQAVAARAIEQLSRAAEAG